MKISSVILSIIPGLGQYNNHQPLKASVFFILTISILYLSLIPGLIIWIIAAIDALLFEDPVTTQAQTSYQERHKEHMSSH